MALSIWSWLRTLQNYADKIYYLAHNYRNRILHNISALRQPNLKNYMRSGTALKIPTIWAQSELASSNTLEVMKEWSSLTHFRKVWKAITPQYLQTPYELMPRRMQAVIDVEGGHTKYWVLYWPFMCNQLVNKSIFQKCFHTFEQDSRRLYPTLAAPKRAL